MVKKIFVPLMLSLSCALLLTACGGSDTSSNNASNTTAANKTATTASTPSTTTTTATPASTTPASGEKIGVAECDDYLARYEACVTGKVPAQARAQYEQSLAQWRKSWHDLAANPQTKATLVQICKTANDQAKQSMKALGCDF